jgi:hypothetical protein
MFHVEREQERWALLPDPYEGYAVKSSYSQPWVRIRVMEIESRRVKEGSLTIPWDIGYGALQSKMKAEVLRMVNLFRREHRLWWSKEGAAPVRFGDAE